jgi:DNA-binding transcriptional LysR family regulator
MTPNFETTERIIAAPASAVSTMFPDLLAQYGQKLPDAGRSILTIGGHWDDAAKTRIRAASLTDGTITGQPLTDGRLAFRCLWQADLAAAFDAGEIEGVEQLTEEQLSTLIPQPEVSL